MVTQHFGSLLCLADSTFTLMHFQPLDTKGYGGETVMFTVTAPFPTTITM
jgi:hypothetical protein